MVTTGGTNLRDDIMRIYQKGIHNNFFNYATFFAKNFLMMFNLRTPKDAP